MKNLGIIRTAFVVMLTLVCTYAQDMDAEIGGLDFKAELAVGFNYDFFISPLDVSFDYPKAYMGMNIPLKYSMPQNVADNLGSQISGQFSDSAASEEYVPEAYAKQNANYSIKVDVPMLGGVLSFSNMQMMYLSYLNNIGIPRLEFGTEEGSELGLMLQGTVGVPVDLTMGWETMTFGYAYEVNDRLKFAFNLHRHTFSFDVKGKVDVNLLGNFSVTISEEGIGDYSIGGKIDYSLHNVIDGHYELERWTPTVAVKYWRFSLTSRFGMNARPSGHLKAKYTLPFFLETETFTLDENLAEGMSDQEKLMDYMTGPEDNLAKFRNNETNTVEYSTTSKMIWKMPQAHTIMFDIIPNKLGISYTKLFGSLYMELSDPFSDKAALTDTTQYADSLDFSFEAMVDHVLMIHGNFYSSFFNIGVYSMDFSFRENKNLLYNIDALKKIRFGNGILAPVLNLGAVVGSKIQIKAELDVLPLMALKTGLIYYF